MSRAFPFARKNFLARLRGVPRARPWLPVRAAVSGVLCPVVAVRRSVAPPSFHRLYTVYHTPRRKSSPILNLFSFTYFYSFVLVHFQNFSAVYIGCLYVFSRVSITILIFSWPEGKVGVYRFSICAGIIAIEYSGIRLYFCGECRTFPIDLML